MPKQFNRSGGKLELSVHWLQFTKSKNRTTEITRQFQHTHRHGKGNSVYLRFSCNLKGLLGIFFRFCTILRLIIFIDIFNALPHVLG